MYDFSLAGLVEFVVDAHLAAAVLLNVLLLYIVRRFSRQSLGTYKNLLAVFAVFDIFLTMVHVLTEPAAVITGTTMGARITALYCSCFTVPFALMNIHFLYRFWSVRSPDRIALFSRPKFIALISLLPIAEFVVWYLMCIFLIAEDDRLVGSHILCEEYKRRHGKAAPCDGWIIMYYWQEHGLHIPTVIALIGFDLIMAVSFAVAIWLVSQTFVSIQKSEKLSAHAHKLQLMLFIAVCAQTGVPLVLVYIPYFCLMNFPFFGLPTYHVDAAWVQLVGCFPAWDAIIIILLIRDYRVGLISMFKSKKKTAMKEATTWRTVSSVMNLSQAPTSTAVTEVA